MMMIKSDCRLDIVPRTPWQHKRPFSARVDSALMTSAHLSSARYTLKYTRSDAQTNITAAAL